MQVETARFIETLVYYCDMVEAKEEKEKEDRRMMVYKSIVSPVEFAC